MTEKRRLIPHLGTPAKPFATCEEIVRTLPSYHDGTLKPRDPELFGYISHHLTHCMICQAVDAARGK